jgi:hypothetical protein
MNRDDAVDLFANVLLDFRDKVREIVEPLPDNELLEVVEVCRQQAQPSDDRNFVMMEWDQIADIIQSEYTMRGVVRKAQAHMAATGEGYYCPHCDGSCTPEHLAELDAELN